MTTHQPPGWALRTTRPGSATPEHGESRRMRVLREVQEYRRSMAMRRCSRTACGTPAIATLTYVYADSTAVLGPLALAAEPHCYDLCAAHAGRLTVPRGWEVVRLQPESYEHRQTHDDLLALADAVREAARPAPEPVPVPAREPVAAGSGGRRSHLRVLRD